MTDECNFDPRVKNHIGVPNKMVKNTDNTDKQRIAELETFIESHGLDVPCQVDWYTEVTNINKGVRNE